MRCLCKMSFYDSGAFGCVVWAIFAALFYGVSRLLLPLIELVPASSSARGMLLIVWSLFFIVSGWWLFLGCVVGNAKARPVLRWVFYGCLGTAGASAAVLVAFIFIGNSIPKDWQQFFGFAVLFGYGQFIFVPTFHWLLDKHAPNR